MERIDALRKGWEDLQFSKGQAAWIAIGSVIATLIVGFGLAGWVSGGTHEKLVTESAANARHELAAAVCADEFLASKDANTRLVTLKDTGWYERGEILAKAGFATMPDRKEPNPTVAAMCAERLTQAK
jgi:hypothetical protein